ncbi:MAG: TetR/AcrR family transcriptional regulator [Acidimicrobiales bacterium]
MAATNVETVARPRGRRIKGLDAVERQAERRRQLLDAALELFATKGYVNTSIEQICQTAFVGTKAFYELFDGKEACYLALLDELTQQMSDRVVAALDSAPDDERGTARVLVAAFAHAVVDDPRVARSTFGQAGGISFAVEEKRRANRRWAAGFLESVWARFGLTSAADGSIHVVAVGLVGGLFDLVIDWLHDAEDVSDIESLIDGLTQFYETVSAGLTAPD